LDKGIQESDVGETAVSQNMDWSSAGRVDGGDDEVSDELLLERSKDKESDEEESSISEANGDETSDADQSQKELFGKNFLSKIGTTRPSHHIVTNGFCFNKATSNCIFLVNKDGHSRGWSL
jgi:hypothetical protein